MPAPIIEVRRVSKRYDSVTALNQVSFAIEEKALVSLLGPSGCGKTTTLRLLAGLETPDSGSIWLKGQAIAGNGHWLPPEQRRVGMVFQDYALFPHLTTRDNIAFGLERSGKHERMQRVDEMLELVGLAGYGGRMPHELSGGQQQRVALARALAPRPDLILLDEPFSNLDASMRTQMRWDVRRILREAGTAAVFVTHDQEEALSLSDKVAVIFNGQLEQFDAPQRLYLDPATPRVAGFVGEANFLDGQASGDDAHTALGTVRLRSEARGSVQIMVRPEQIHLSHDGQGQSVQVLWREYYGHDQRIGLALENGDALIARTDTQASYAPGDRLFAQLRTPLLAFPR